MVDRRLDRPQRLVRDAAEEQQLAVLSLGGRGVHLHRRLGAAEQLDVVRQAPRELDPRGQRHRSLPARSGIRPGHGLGRVAQLHGARSAAEPGSEARADDWRGSRCRPRLLPGQADSECDRLPEEHDQPDSARVNLGRDGIPQRGRELR